MAKRWHYSGDVNPEYGGTWFDVSEWKHGYASAVEITDLESAIGFTGAVEIASKTVPVDYPDRWPGALACIGCKLTADGGIDDNGGAAYKRDSLPWRLCLAHALLSYGACDTELTETLQLQRAEPMEHHARGGGTWRADKRLRGNASLARYVRRHWLNGSI